MKHLLLIFLLAACTTTDNSEILKRVDNLEAKQVEFDQYKEENNFLLAETRLKLQDYIDSLAILNALVKNTVPIDLTEITSEIDSLRATIVNLEASDNYLYDEININTGNIGDLGVNLNELSQDMFNLSFTTDSTIQALSNKIPEPEIWDHEIVENADSPKVKVYADGAVDYWKLVEATNDTIVISHKDTIVIYYKPELPDTTEILFQTGYEESDWKDRMETALNTDISFQYSCDDLSKNYYELCSDPVDPNNQVLRFRINDTCDYSGRVQMTIRDLDREVYHFSQRYFIGSDLSLVNWMWFALIELWDESDITTWKTGDPAGQARWSLSLEKVNGSLRWKANGEIRQPKDSSLFKEYSYYPVPIVWFTIDFYMYRFIDGIFRITIQPDGEEKYILFDINAPTVYPGHYKPIHYMQPCKYYLNKEAVYNVKNGGGTNDMFYDEFKLYKN